MELEEIQINSRKIVDGPLKVWFAIVSLTIVLLDFESQIVALAIFPALIFYSMRKMSVNYIIFFVPVTFLLIATAVILFTLDGNEVMRVGFLKITDRSLEVSLKTLLRSISAVTILGYLILTTTLPEFLSAFKLPKFLHELMSLVYRSIQVLLEEAEKLKRSSESRLGFLGFKRSFRSVVNVSIMLFLKSLHRVEKFEMAKEARCYSGKFPSISYENKGLIPATLIIFTLFLGLIV